MSSDVIMNLPDYDTDFLSFGPGIVYLGAVGSTPTEDVGATNEGMQLRHEVEPLEAFQGSNDTIIRSFRESEVAVFSFEAFEFKTDNLSQYISAGHVDGNHFAFGGDIEFVEASLRLVHEMPRLAHLEHGSSGEVQKFAYIDVWRARSDGDLDLAFDSDLFGFELDFLALPASQNWIGESLNRGEEFYRIELRIQVVGATYFVNDLEMTSSVALTVS